MPTPTIHKEDSVGEEIRTAQEGTDLAAVEEKVRPLTQKFVNEAMQALGMEPASPTEILEASAGRLKAAAKKMAQWPGAIYAGSPISCQQAASATGQLPPRVAEAGGVPDGEVLKKMGFDEVDVLAFTREANRTTGLKVDSCEPGVWPNVDGMEKEYTIHEKARQIKEIAKEAPEDSMHFMKHEASACTCGPNDGCSDCPPDRWTADAVRGRIRKRSEYSLAQQAMNAKEEVEEDIKAYLRAEEMTGDPAFEAVLAEVQRRFSGLKLSWRNGRMYIGDTPTKIGCQRVTWVFRELRGLGGEKKVREIVADMIASKLEEVFEPAGYRMF